MSEPYAGLPKRQHYVPQFLLRRFAGTGRKIVYVFDKRTGNTWPSAVEKSASEKDYYNVPRKEVVRIWETARAAGLVAGDPPEAVSLEPALATIESSAATAIDRIHTEQSLACLNAKARQSLALFAAVQFLRGPAQRNTARQVHQMLVKHVIDLVDVKGGDSERELRRHGLWETEGQAEVMLSLQLVVGADSFLPYFLGRDWVLFRTPADHPLLIGDSPALLTPLHPDEEQERGLLRGLGLSSSDGQVMLPLGSRLCLVMLPPTWTARVRRLAADAPRIRAAGLVAPGSPHAEMLVKAVDTGDPLDFTPDNVLHSNSRQVWHSARYVYADASRFDLVRDMIARDERVRYGPQIQVG